MAQNQTESTQTENELVPLWDGFQYFDHQVEGVRWMLQKEQEGTMVEGKKPNDPQVCVRGGFQCDEMGLGKTIQVVGTMVNHAVLVTVLLAPLAMVETWTSVCQRAGFRVFQAVGGDWHLLGAQGTRSEEVYITNFERLYTTPRLFREMSVDRIVLDEAHKIRNPDGQMAIYARRLKAPIRWAVTGTPLVNSWRDVVSLLAFVGVPCSPLWRWDSRLCDLLPEIVLHRSLEELRDVLADAPPYPLTEHWTLPFATEKEKEFYLAIQGATIAQAGGYDLDALSRMDRPTSAIPSPMDHLTPQEAFLLLLRLRQISVHPQVYINAKRRESQKYLRKDWIGPSTKLLAVRKILESDKAIAESQEGTNDHKYIIFCQFKEEMEILRDYLADGLVEEDHILEYDGSLTQAERAGVLRRSKELVGPTVLLLQLQAGGVGLNLQEYDRIIFNSPWWTSALMDQAIARAVRMGQKRMVKIFHLHLEAEETAESVVFIDQLIHAKAEEKRAMLLEFFAMCHPCVEEEQVQEQDQEQEEQEQDQDQEEQEQDQDQEKQEKDQDQEKQEKEPGQA